ncbi:murein hydrolase activator EnvC family protein [Sphingomicrobium flavum]|uniref:murein hydrolase activator EnvC family protein n=1 Tax=Sphingomicrobium flavum TaxID=1229164 RepID=UPI0021ADC82B|nr:peptidoglycan DD-metalloendopeptidase family protein [Sphingomicrobium flavum]
MRALALLLLLGATSVAAQDSRPPSIEERLAIVQKEAAASENRAAALQAQAEKAGSEAERLAADRAALAERIAADEARISETQLKLAALKEEQAAQAKRLEARRAPLAGLVAGIVTMDRQPPLLALVDSGSVREMVRTQALIDSSLAAIEERSADIRAETRRSRDLEQRARAELAELDRRVTARDEARQRFAAREAEARTSAADLLGQAFAAQGEALAVAENLAELADTAERRRESRAQARALAQYDAAPARPANLSRTAGAPHAPFAYRLPVDAPVLRGMGSLTEGGMRARGIRFDSRRGASVIVPADGRIAYAGAFRGYDGVVIIDHGDDWASLITGLASQYAEGDRIKAGAQLGRALGPLSVELWDKGVPRSPALIAGSSKIMSNRRRTS